MRVAHVVTYASRDGAYGGPTRVAVNLCTELARRGHDVHLFVGRSRNEQLDLEVDGATVHSFPVWRLFPGLGFAGLVSPRLLLSLARQLRDFDVVHVHLARDLISMPAAALALLRRVPLVVQTHGMVDRSERTMAKVLDLLLTRPVLKRARAVLCLTSRESADVAEVARQRVRVAILPNGVPQTAVCRKASTDGTARLLFAARLHPRKRVIAFAHLINLLWMRGADVAGIAAGSDEGDGAEFKEFLAAHPGIPLRWEGSLPHEAVVKLMASSDLFVLPSVDEPFPMGVLEAMAVGVPALVCESNGLASVLRHSGAGLVVPDDSLEKLVEACERIIAHPGELDRMGGAACRLVSREFSIVSVVNALVEIYRKVLDCGSLVTHAEAADE